MKWTTCKDLNKLIRCYIKSGWTYENGKKHGRLIMPSGNQFVTISKTPGDRRAVHEVKAQINRLLNKQPEQARGLG